MDRSLGEFEQLVLMAICHVAGEAYGVSIRDELVRRADREVSLGAIYTTLDRLVRKGYLESRVGAPTPERGGRRKRLYQLTPHGADVLERSLSAVQRLSKGLHRHLAAFRGHAE